MAISIAKVMSKAVRSIHMINSRSLMTKADEGRRANISFEVPDKLITCQLAISIKQNPVRAFIRGMWMGFLDDEGLVSLVNGNPTPDDFLRARSVLRNLTDEVKVKLKTFWPSESGGVRDYLSHEHAKHSLTAYSKYRPWYFEDALKVAEPYLAGGSNELAAFMEENFQVGKKYPIAHVEDTMSKHVSASVGLRLGHSVDDGTYLNGITIPYFESRGISGWPLELWKHPCHPIREDKDKEITVLLHPPRPKPHA